jgi:hypothetical protein
MWTLPDHLLTSWPCPHQLFSTETCLWYLNRFSLQDWSDFIPKLWENAAQHPRRVNNSAACLMFLRSWKAFRTLI